MLKHLACRHHLAACMGFALTLVIYWPTLLTAQRRVPDEQRIAEQRKERDLAERQFLLRALGKSKNKDPEVSPATINLQQVKKDFEGMQLANNDILIALASNRPLDHKQISADTSKIRRFASGLKTQLSLPVSDKANKGQLMMQEPLRATLLHLDAFIASFVNNPIFDNAGYVLDARHSIQASRDLDNIIDLSGRIRKSTAQRQKQE